MKAYFLQSDTDFMYKTNLCIKSEHVWVYIGSYYLKTNFVCVSENGEFYPGYPYGDYFPDGPANMNFMPNSGPMDMHIPGIYSH